MFGLINIRKPAGWTSRDVVNRVQRWLRPEKVGHAGTLDPLATGVLIVCVGPATRLVPYIQLYPKTYIAEFLLGCTSETDDTEGTVTPLPAPPRLSADDVRAVLPQFVGRILQTPPAHSAVKVHGRRAYDLARQGTTFALEPKPVDVYRLELLDFQPDRLMLEIECGSGTYIRSLGRDLGQALGSGAVMTQLCRTRIGPFSVTEGLDVDRLTRASLTAVLQPPARAVELLPQAMLSDDECAKLRHGQRIARGGLCSEPEGTELAVLDPRGGLVGLVEVLPGGWLAPRIMFPAQASQTDSRPADALEVR